MNDMTPIHLVLSVPFEKLPAGSSRFWGNPDLPKGFGYPMYTDDDGDEYPYCFVCQINLKEIASYDTDNLLPHSGLLSFFAKIDHYLGYYAATDNIGGGISGTDAVRVIYFPSCETMDEVVLLDENDKPMSPDELQIGFRLDVPPLSDEHMLFAPPSHRPWETWDPPYEDWSVLLQVDSFCGADFNLNFMDFGVLDFLISPSGLKEGRFDDVRAIVLST